MIDGTDIDPPLDNYLCSILKMPGFLEDVALNQHSLKVAPLPWVHNSQSGNHNVLGNLVRVGYSGLQIWVLSNGLATHQGCS